LRLRCKLKQPVADLLWMWVVVHREVAGRVTNAQSLKSRSAVGGSVMSRGAGHGYAPYKKPAMDVRSSLLYLRSVHYTDAGLNVLFFYTSEAHSLNAFKRLLNNVAVYHVAVLP